MAMIRVENLTFSYPSSCDPVFENVSFQMDTEWKLGFVGRNGRGKTTFLKLLLGKYEHGGRITGPVEFEYFPFEVPDQSRLTEEILRQINPRVQDWEMMRELSYLEVREDVLWRPFDSLSKGEQTKVLLAALFLKDECVLLIDEPTNHLDAPARRQVAAYLKKKKGFILVSHDRYLLDACVDHILALNRTDIEVQSGNFSTWLEQFQSRQTSEANQNERLKREIYRMKESARQAGNWSDRVEASKRGAADKGYVGHKAAKMMKRSKHIEARKEQAIREKEKLLKNAEYAEELRMNPIPFRSETLVSFSDVSIVYNGCAVCEPVTFDILRGERILLDGKNGSGKSSLLKLLSADRAEHTGTVQVSSGLVISFVPQDASWLEGDLTEFAEIHKLDESLFKAILRKMDFQRIQFEKDMKDFSAGQKKKVLLAKSLCEPAHLYVWDEPLNYMDVYSRMQIEQLILQFLPTMLLVEHDVTFGDRIATRRVRI